MNRPTRLLLASAVALGALLTGATALTSTNGTSGTTSATSTARTHTATSSTRSLRSIDSTVRPSAQTPRTSVDASAAAGSDTASPQLASGTSEQAAADSQDDDPQGLEAEGRDAAGSEAQSTFQRIEGVWSELLGAAQTGEISQTDAQRVATELSEYISGKRTLPAL